MDIRVPWRIGYDFAGYYGLGGTPLIVNAEGTICVKSDFFKMNAKEWEIKATGITKSGSRWLVFKFFKNVKSCNNDNMEDN